MEESVKELIEYLKNVSPVIWDAAVRQVYVNVIQNTAGFVGSIILILCCRYTFIKTKGWDSEELFQIFGIIGIAIGVIVGFACLIEGFGYLANPEYYAIKNLTTLLMGK